MPKFINPHISLRLAASFLALTITSAMGCQHANANQPSPEKLQEEVVVLRERVAKLERQLGEMDTRFQYLLDKKGNPTAPVAGPVVVPIPSKDTKAPPSYVAVNPEPVRAEEGQETVDIGVSPTYLPPAPTPMRVADWASKDEQYGKDAKDGQYGKDKKDGKDSKTGKDNESAKISLVGDVSPGEEVIDLNPLLQTSTGKYSDKKPDKNLDKNKQQPVYTTTNPTTNPVMAAAKPVDTVATLYTNAQNALQNLQYDVAINMFQEIQKKYPKHDYADNSMYWEGFAEQQRGQCDRAVTVWQKLPHVFASSPKIPDGMFGIAQCAASLGRNDEAIAMYTQLINQYPKAERYSDAVQAVTRLRNP